MGAHVGVHACCGCLESRLAKRAGQPLAQRAMVPRWSATCSLLSDARLAGCCSPRANPPTHPPTAHHYVYSTDRIEMHVGAVQPGQRVVLVDDLIATGGTLRECLPGCVLLFRL